VSEQRGARIRGPIVAAALIAALVVGGGFSLERSLGTRPSTTEEVPEEVSGAWFCPHGGGDRWRTWVVAANPSTREAALRIVTHGDSDPSSQEVTVAPGTQRYVEVPAEGMASGTMVEFFGAPVATGMISSRDERGLAAEPCVDAPGTTWYLAEATTERGYAQRIVVMNPFADRAVFDVTLMTDDEVIRAGDLTGIVLPPRRVSAVNLGEYALGKRSLAAVIQVRLGRVASAAVGSSQRGLRTTVGVRAPARTWVLPGAADRDPSELVVLALGRGVPYRVRAQSADEQVEVVGEADVAPRTVETLELEAQGRSLVVVSEGDAPFVAARRLTRRDDRAGTSGAVEGAAGWVALPAGPPEGATSVLVVENPGGEVAEVRVVLLTRDGRAEAPTLARVVVPAGRAVNIPLEDLVGDEPVSALVEATQGLVVVAQAAHTEGGYAMATGVPLDPLGEARTRGIIGRQP
jgi:hypothetical protein